MNKKRVPTKGPQERYSCSPIWSLAMPETYSNTASTKFCSPLGTCSSFSVPRTAIVRIMAITSHVTNNTCPCTVKPAMSQYKCVPTSTAANEKNINRFIDVNSANFIVPCLYFYLLTVTANK